MNKLTIIFYLFILLLSAYGWQYQVTHYTDSETGHPSWSPDGTKIAYHAKVGGKFDIYTISSAGGGTPTRITSSANYNICPSWSPDGTKIAFFNCVNNDFPVQVRYVTLATGQETTIAAGYDPSWSPDSKYLVYVKGDNNETSIWKRELSTGIETQLTFTDGIEQSPDWSHNGQNIIYNFNNITPSIWIIPALGGTPTQVPVYYGYGPKYYPSGELITFDAGNSMGGYSIYVFNLVTHNLFQATPSSTQWCVEPDWACGGGKIAYHNASIGNIWVITYGTSVEATSLGQIKSLYK